ncbi:MAG: hypothetical protein WCG67_07895 [Ferruginibacter sp.]
MANILVACFAIPPIIKSVNYSMSKLNEKASLITIIGYSEIYAAGIFCHLKNAGFVNTSVLIKNENDLYAVEQKTQAKHWVLYHVNVNHEYRNIAQQLKDLKQQYPTSKIILYSDDFSENILSGLFNNELNGYFILSENADVIYSLMSTINLGEIAMSKKVLHSYLVHKKIMRLKEQQNVISVSDNIYPLPEGNSYGEKKSLPYISREAILQNTFNYKFG